MSLRIGIDATCLASQRGYGRFLRELLPPLLAADRTNEYVLFADRHGADPIESLPARWVRPASSESQAQAASAHGNRRPRDLWRMGRAVAREGLDVMYFPSVYSYFPVPARTRIAVGFHDTIPERHGQIVFASRRTRWLWNTKVWLARRQARAFLTVSDWSRRALIECFGLPPERIFVTVEAPSPAFAPVDDHAQALSWLRARALPEQDPYVIYVGGFNPHKNLGSLVDAVAGLPSGEAQAAPWLLLVGDLEGDPFHADLGALRARIAAAGLGERVHFAGFVPDAELRHLYAGALALALPSLEEGFGLPAVEAAACGTPCVATRNSPLPELLARGGLFVDPAAPGALREALDRLCRDTALRADLAKGALAAARELSWEDTARATRCALESIATGPA